MLRETRPENLPPVPSSEPDLEEESDRRRTEEAKEVEVEGGSSKRRKQSPRSEDRGRARGRTGESTGSSKKETFRTPEMDVSGNRKKTEEMRASTTEAREARGSGETLERALEKEMEEWMKREGFGVVNPFQREMDRLKEENMELLRRQNSKLLGEVERLTRVNKLMENQQYRVGEEEVGMSDWSEVSPPIPRPESPERKSSGKEEEGLRFTPGGTQVPDGPPPEETEEVNVRVPEFP